MVAQETIFEKAKEALGARQKTILIEGTAQHGKFPVAFYAMLALAEEFPCNYLIRVLGMNQAEAIADHADDGPCREFMRRLMKARVIEHDSSRVWLDTTTRQSQKKTPANIRGAIIYCAEAFDAHVDQVQDLEHRIKSGGKLFLPTWTDNKSIEWVEAFRPYHVVLHTSKPQIHKEMLALANHKTEGAYFSGERAGSDEAGANPALWQQALDFLTSGVNVTTGIGHPSDKNMCIQMFKELYELGERPDAESVRAYLIGKGWSGSGSAAATAIWTKILERPNRTFRGFRMGTRRYLDDIGK